MKKIFIIILLILSILYLKNSKEDYITDAIRFRVISNSNSPYDILMKEKVVKDLSNLLFQDYSKDETRSNILNNLQNIEKRIQNIFDDNNYTQKFNIMYGINEFPEKIYKGKKYDAGNYESLVIEIGDAKGDNYWCFLYPSLCLQDYNESENNKIDFKIKNIFDSLF